MFRTADDVAARVAPLVDFVIFVISYGLLKWAATILPPADEFWTFWLEWVIPLIPAVVIAVFITPRTKFEVRWHIDEVAAEGRRYFDFNLTMLKQATGAAEVSIAATLVPRFHSLLGWVLALRAERRGYWVRVTMMPNGVMGVKAENRADGKWVLDGKESFRLDIDNPSNGVQGARFSGYLVAKRVQLQDRVEFTVSLRRNDDRPVRFLGTASSSAKGLEVRR